MKSIIGIILTLIPFVHVLAAERASKVRARFIQIVVGLIAVHVVIGMGLQALGLFRYVWVITCYVLVFGASLFFVPWRNVRTFLRRWSIDWVAIGVVALSIFALAQVHYAYTGKYSVALDSAYKEAEAISYAYPYFSDEWYAASFAGDAIERQSLPLQNPLTPDTVPFVNFECVFHSLLAEIALFFGFDPVQRYAILMLMNGMLLCLLGYLFLRSCGVMRFASSFGALSMLFITNSGALPGLWTLIPLMGGITLFLSFCFFLEVRDRPFQALTFFLTLLIYPPLVLFCVCAYLLRGKRLKTLLLIILLLVVSGGIVALFYAVPGEKEKGLVAYVWGKLWYAAFLKEATPLFYPWVIVPLPFLFLGVAGLVFQFKKRFWLIAPVVLGSFYWCAYFFTTQRFIIDFERVVVFSALLVTLASGFSVDLLLRKVNSTVQRVTYVSGVILCVGALFFYTQLSSWEKIRLYHYGLEKEFQTAAPVNQHLTPDDVRIFSSLHKNTFLAPPWKGTVLGVATNNYPLTIKPGTITIYPLLYPQFMNAPADKKHSLALEYGAQFIYSHPFIASGFTLIDKSDEGLCLYRVES